MPLTLFRKDDMMLASTRTTLSVDMWKAMSRALDRVERAQMSYEGKKQKEGLQTALDIMRMEFAPFFMGGFAEKGKE